MVARSNICCRDIDSVVYSDHLHQKSVQNSSKRSASLILIVVTDRLQEWIPKTWYVMKEKVSIRVAGMMYV